MPSLENARSIQIIFAQFLTNNEENMEVSIGFVSEISPQICQNANSRFSVRRKDYFWSLQTYLSPYGTASIAQRSPTVKLNASAIRQLTLKNTVSMRLLAHFQSTRYLQLPQAFHITLVSHRILLGPGSIYLDPFHFYLMRGSISTRDASTKSFNRNC